MSTIKPAMLGYLDLLPGVSESDVVELLMKERTYKGSWKRRGGVGAFMMLARKWDRLENQVEECKYDIFEVVRNDPSPTGPIDDIRDLRRYLLLVESELIAQGIVK